MRTQFFTIPAIAAIATATSIQETSYPSGETWKKLLVTVDGESRDLYLAGTSWSEIGNDSSPATPGDMFYGGSCSTSNDDFCWGGSCDCRWSWSRDGHWEDPDAACRCKPEPAAYVPSDDFEIGFNARVYFSESQTWDKDAYFKPNLLGGSMEYDVDLSEVTCGCNAAMYMIGMPGIGSDGNPFPSKDGMYYCDANKVDGNFCPEFDIMEANVHAYRAVEHACDAPDSNGYYNSCDRYGQCAVDVITDYSSSLEVYGPGSNYQINTEREFHIKVDFETDEAGEFAQYTISLTQDDYLVQMVQNCPAELHKMTQDIENGMTIAMSIWESENLDWLQHGECNTSCGEIMGQSDQMPDLRMKNFVFTTAAGGSGNGGSDNTGDNGNGGDDGNSNGNGGTTVLTDIAAGFEQIKNNPHYGDKLSRTLYQVDQTFDFVEAKLIEMSSVLNQIVQN